MIVHVWQIIQNGYIIMYLRREAAAMSEQIHKTDGYDTVHVQDEIWFLWERNVIKRWDIVN